MWKASHGIRGLNTWSPAGWWWYFRSLWNLSEAEPYWRKWATGDRPHPTSSQFSASLLQVLCGHLLIPPPPWWIAGTTFPPLDFGFLVVGIFVLLFYFVLFLFWRRVREFVAETRKVTYRSPQILFNLHLKQIENLHKLTGSSEIPGPSINLLALTSTSCILSLPSHGEWENNKKPLVFLF